MFFFVDNYTLLSQTDAEFREQQLTYVKNSGNYTKVFEDGLSIATELSMRRVSDCMW